MIGVEYRAYVKVDGIGVESEQAENLLSALEERHGSLGPVLSGAVDGLEVVVATDAENEADAASHLIAAVADALAAIGLGAFYPAAVSLEPAEEPAPA